MADVTTSSAVDSFLQAANAAAMRTAIALGNLDNTSDANKPVSTAQQTALDLKASASGLSAHISDTANPHAVTKTQVGLSDADNTADSAKPVSVDQQAALDLKADLASLQGFNNRMFYYAAAL